MVALTSCVASSVAWPGWGSFPVGFGSGAVVVLPSRREKIPRVVEEYMPAAEHAAVHSLV